MYYLCKVYDAEADRKFFGLGGLMCRDLLSGDVFSASYSDTLTDKNHFALIRTNYYGRLYKFAARLSRRSPLASFYVLNVQDEEDLLTKNLSSFIDRTYRSGRIFRGELPKFLPALDHIPF